MSAFDLILEPWIPGDLATIAAWENDQEEKIDRMLDYFEDDRWVFITPRDVEEAFEIFGIDYPNLPNWLKDKIDEINIT